MNGIRGSRRLECALSAIVRIGIKKERERRSKTKCSILDCERGAICKGLCGSHYEKQRRSKIKCSVPDCTNTLFARGVCSKHYVRIRKYGTVNRVSRNEMKNRIYVEDGVGKIELYDRNRNIKGTALIDKEDIDKVKDFHWNLNAYGLPVCTGKFSLPEKVLGVKSTLKEPIDHKNRNRIDNRKENLRKCSQRINIANRGLKPGKSGYVGVHTDNHGKTYFVCIGIGKTNQGTQKRLRIGPFKSKVEAALAYNKKVKDLFGEVVFQNEIREE